MAPQNYSAVDAFQRWAGSDLRKHLRIIRRKYLWHRWIGGVSPLELRALPRAGILTKYRTITTGRVTWAVFARAYWAIYQRGVSPGFYGSVLVSDDPSDESSPALFEISEYSRRVREFDVPLDGIKEYAHVIRNDDSPNDRIEVPVALAMKPGVWLHTILVERAKLPLGYLHHRLVPVVYVRGSPFVSIIHHRYWGAEFRALWSAGDSPLPEEELRIYRDKNPEVVP